MTTTSIVAAVVLLGLGWFLVEARRRKTDAVSGGVDSSKTLPHDHKVELYGNSFSHCSRKTRMVLAELDLAYGYHAIDLIETGWYQTISPGYLQINPAGLVPTLVHEGHPVYESDDILAYVQQLTGDDAQQLVPSDKALQAQMHEWLDFCAIVSDNPMGAMQDKAGACIPGLTLPLFATAIRYTPLHNILIGFLFHPDKKRPAMFTSAKLLGLQRMLGLPPVQTLIANSRDHMARHLVTLNSVMMSSGGPWILGEQYSLADVSIACLLLRLEETCWMKHFFSTLELSELEAYLQRLQARPSWQSAITNHAHPQIERAKRDLSNLINQEHGIQQRLYFNSR